MRQTWKTRLSAIVLSVAMILTGIVPGLTAVAAELPTTDMKGEIVILHTNDVHGAIDGYAKIAAVKKAFQEKGAYVLLVDAGDYSQGSVEVSAFKGTSAVELMNLAGYDAATVGNHELDYGFQNLKNNVEVADFPILCANLLYEGETAFETSTMFKTPDGKKIGVFGLITPDAATSVHPSKQEGVTYLSSGQLYECAQWEVDQLKAEGADYIICLGHLGIDKQSAGGRSVDVLAHVKGIDVLIDGHSHSTMEEEQAELAKQNIETTTILTSTGTKYANIGVVTIDAEGITADSLDPATLNISEESVGYHEARITNAINYAYGEVFATTEVLLNGEKAPGNRTEETNLGDLITDALVWSAGQNGEKVDCAVTNGGGIRATIEEGPVTKKDINKVLPFGNTVAIVQLTGAEILEMLEASTCVTPEAIGGFPQVSGIKYTVNTAAAFDAGENYPGSTYAKPNSINRVTIQSIGGAVFNPKKVYMVATNDFTAAGGDTYYTMKAATQKFDTGLTMDEEVMKYIETVLNGKITAEQYGKPQGRITIK